MTRAHAAHSNPYWPLGRPLVIPLFLAAGLQAVAAVAIISDPQLDDAAHSALSKPLGQLLTSLDLTNLTSLRAPNQEISNLSGLDQATNLATLNLDANAITDLTPLVPLWQLTCLSLAGNNIRDVSALSPLTNLVMLDLSANPVRDYSPLTNLSRLTRLSIHDNTATNLGFLLTLPQLTELNIGNNPVTNVAPLTGLTNLSLLDARWAGIANPNALGRILGQAHNLARLYLGGNAITNVRFLTNLTALTFLNLDQNQIQFGEQLATLTNLTYLVMSHNPSTNYTWMTNLNRLVNLELRGNSLSDVSFLSNLAHLAYADLACNRLSDLSPLAGLTNLSLVLDGNTNLTTFPTGTSFSRLWLGSGSIKDLSFLTNQTSLTALGLENNGLTNLSYVSGLTNLEHLALSRNPALNLQPLSNLTRLTALRLEGNSMTNAGFLTGLTHLSVLSLNSNRISDLSPLTNLPGLSSLFLSHNRVTNISNLTLLANLQFLDVSLNPMDTTSNSATKATLRTLRAQKASVTYLPTNQLFFSLALPTSPDWFIPWGRTRSLGVFAWDQVVPPCEYLFGTNSSNQGVIPNSLLSIQGTNYGRTFTVSAAALGTTTLGVSVADAPGGMSLSTNFITHVLPSDPNFAIPDPNLDKTFSTVLGLAAGELTSVDLLDVPPPGSLNASGRGITNLAGLEWATNLTSLNLAGNFVTSLGPLRNLTGLTCLNLASNRVSDISPLTGLTNLTSLNLSFQAATNFALLSNLTNLTSLGLSGTSLTNLGFLTNLGLLVSLDLSSNKLTDVSALGQMPSLRRLSLSQNRLTNVSSLTSLTLLTNLDLTLNLLDVVNDPTIQGLQARTNLLLLAIPQRGPPIIDIRTNWIIAASSPGSSLPFSIEDTGPADQQVLVSVVSSSANLVPGLNPGTNQNGVGSWTLIVNPVNPGSNPGWITLAATNDVGLSASTTVLVEMTNVVPVTAALLGDPALSWTTTGNAPWFVQNFVTHNGHPVAQSGNIGNNQASFLQTTVIGPGILSFWWKVSSESCCDFLQFTLDGTIITSIAGEVDWQFQQFLVLPGSQTLTWEYYKDPGLSIDLDAGWVDQVTFQPATWLTFVGVPSAGQANLQLFAQPGRIYELQVTTNQQGWIGLRPLVVGSAPYVSFTDTNANSSARLYRLKDFSLTLEPPRLLADGSAQVVVHNYSGQPFDWQVSSDLALWNSLGTVTNINHDVTNIDLFATNSSVRFYRAVVHE